MCFTVNPFTPFSDHSKITVYLKKTQSNYEVPRQCPLYSIPHSYRWTPESTREYQKALENYQIHNFTDLFLSEMFPHNDSGINLAVDKINAIFHHLASLSNLKISKLRSKQINNNKWFDKECKNLRRTLRK